MNKQTPKAGQALRTIAKELSLRPDHDDWIVGGSAGLALRGLPLPAEPRDLDLYADEPDFLRLHRVLKPYAVSEPELSETDMYRSTLCRYEVEGVPVELVGGFTVRARGCIYTTEVKEGLKPYAPVVPLGGGFAAPVVPLAHELWFNALRGRADRVQTIVEAFQGTGTDEREALDFLERRNGFPAHALLLVHTWIRRGKAGELPEL